MKTPFAIVILVLCILVYKYLSDPSYEPITFIPNEPVINNEGQWFEWHTIRGVIQNLVKKRDFAQLESKVNEARKNHYKFFNSKGVLYELYNVIVIDLPDYEAIHKFIAEWRAFKPDSNIPDILEVRALRHKAWAIRSNAYADRVTDEQFQGFYDYLELAHQSAIIAEQKGPMDVELCREQVGLSFVLLKDKSLALDYFEKCKSIDSDYVHLYYTMRAFLQKIWFGSDRELQYFIEKSAEETRSSYGEGMYSLLVADHTFNTSKIFPNNGGRYSWPRTKAGFQHL